MGKCLVPGDKPGPDESRGAASRQIDGLLAVGRSAWGIPDTLPRNRIAVQHMGQAAGMAAAMAAKAGVQPRQLDVEALRRRLLERGCYLGDAERLKQLGLAGSAQTASPQTAASGSLP